MGLRTASVRHPHVVDMAPALTETVQTQNFDLPPKSCLEPAYPLKSFTKNKYQLKTQLYSKEGGEDVQQYPLNSSEITNTATILKEKILEKYWDNIVTASDIDNLPNLNSNMNESPSSMGDQGNNKMGLQITDFNVSPLSREKSSNDMEQLLQNLNSVLPDAVEGVTTGDVEDIMQVIKSFEGTERLNNSANDLNSEGEEIFHIGGTDLTNNFSLTKEFLEGVDVMNMSMEDQQDDLDSEVVQKESQADEVLEALKKKHQKVERRLDFLKRRVYKLETRFTGQHISNEIAGVFENVSRNMKKSKDDESSFAGSLLANRDMMPMKPMSYSSTKTIVKKLEMSKILQANNSARQKGAPKYFGSGSIEVPPPRGANSAAVHLAPWPMDTKSELQKVVGQLKTQTSLTQRDIDSEATESSSGGESCDEMISYNNPHQQYLSIQKRALWKYSSDRAAIGARWTWLQAQIADLEYRIRQHSDLAKQIRASKAAVQLGGDGPEQSVQATLNGYRGQLPGSSPAAAKAAAEGAAVPETDVQCARTRPLTAFKKRKLLQIAGLHAVSRKAARPSGLRCGCVPLALPPCALCTGRTDPTLPRDPIDAMGGAEKVAMLDGGYHPVFSLPEDTSENIHLEALMKTQDWQLRSNRMKTYKVLKPDRLEPKSVDHRTRKLEHRKKYGRLLKPTTMSALSAKIRSKFRGRKPGARRALDRVHRQRRALDADSRHAPDYADDEVAALGAPGGYCLRSADSPSASPLLHAHAVASGHKRNKFQAYDIDNIVIPYSVAAATRVEKLQYKEILTPKWRIAETDCSLGGYDAVNNGAVKEFDQDSDTEDVTEEAVLARHDRAERDEKQRFLGYLKLPAGRGGAGRAPRRADSRADESSEAPTPPDAMSPPPTPAVAEQAAGEAKEESRGASPADLLVEVVPYESRTFPIDDPTYAQMLDHMPENHRQFRTNARSQDALFRFAHDDDDPPSAPYEGRAGSPADSESTESAVGEDAEEEDPNDPEWVDVERGVAKERYRR